MGILSAIGSAVSTVASPIASYFGAKYAADKQYEMWHEQRDWNTPAAQMARYKAAGVNPYAALGQISSGNIGTMPQAPDFSEAAQGVGNVVSNAVSLLSQKQALKSQKLDNELKEQTLESDRLNSIVGLMSAYQDLKAKQNQNSIFDTEAKIKEWSLYNLVKDYDKKGVDVGLLNHELNQRMIWDDVFNRQKFLKGSEDIRGRQAEIQYTLRQFEKLGIDISLLDSLKRLRSEGEGYIRGGLSSLGSYLGAKAGRFVYGLESAYRNFNDYFVGDKNPIIRYGKWVDSLDR